MKITDALRTIVELARRNPDASDHQDALTMVGDLRLMMVYLDGFLERQREALQRETEKVARLHAEIRELMKE